MFLNAGYVPVITHPERLRWCEENYQDFVLAARMGAWLQVTASAISGTFGRTAKRCAERLLLDGVVHIIASDAHNVEYRPPILSEGIEAAIRFTGDDIEIMRMVNDRPFAILDNIEPFDVLLPPGLITTSLPVYKTDVDKKRWLERLFY
jgi:protein-tyrosine phosphatase